MFVLTMLATATFWTTLGPPTGDDSGTDYAAFYEPVARSIVTSSAPVYPDGRPATRYPPGYPFVLASLFGLAAHTGVSEVAVVKGFALLGTAMSGVFLFLLARSVWPAPWARVTPLLWATCPLVLWLSGLQGSEVAFLVVFYAACYCFWRGLNRYPESSLSYCTAGVLVGCAMLIRPIAIGVGLIMAAFAWFALKGRVSSRRRLIAATLIVAGNLVVVTPWEWWVFQRSGKFILLSEGGVRSIRDGLTFATNLKGFRRGTTVPASVESVMRHFQSHYDELETFGDIEAAIREQARTNPKGLMQLLLLKTARSWYATDSHRFEFQILIVQAMYLVPILLGSCVAWYQRGRMRLLVLFVWLLACYFWAMTIVVLSIVRYMVPVLGLLFLLAPGAFIAVRRKLSGMSGPDGFSSQESRGSNERSFELRVSRCS